MSHRKNSNSDGATSAIAFVLIVIFAMPLVGIYLLSQKNQTDKTWGAVLTVAGFILWIVIAIISA